MKENRFLDGNEAGHGNFTKKEAFVRGHAIIKVTFLLAVWTSQHIHIFGRGIRI